MTYTLKPWHIGSCQGLRWSHVAPGAPHDTQPRCSCTLRGSTSIDQVFFSTLRKTREAHIQTVYDHTRINKHSHQPTNTKKITNNKTKWKQEQNNKTKYYITKKKPIPPLSLPSTAGIRDGPWLVAAWSAYWHQLIRRQVRVVFQRGKHASLTLMVV